MKKVRNEWGLTNVIPMVPFCRTPEEGEKVVATMKEFGLKQGENGLQIYVMCEIPSNVILAEEFAKIFDGFSIGSNDLTQLTLGVDRDSSLVSHVYSERNPAVMNLIRDVIRVAHKHKRKIGICGQAPSDHPEFAEFLVREGIDSISLNPDTIVKTRERIAYTEKTIGKRGKKTSSFSVGIIAIVAAVSGLMMALGAGCVNTQTDVQTASESSAELYPAMLRTKLMEKMAAEKAQFEKTQLNDLRNRTNTLHESTFGGGFTIHYPILWSSEHNNNEIVLLSPHETSTPEWSVRIYEDIKASSIPSEVLAKALSIADGKK
jgi:hypothetical protein